MYTVIGMTASRTLRVLWMLEELGAPYQHRPEKPRSDTVSALNPSGKIPVLLDDGAALTDSTAILQYLADKHGRLTKAPGTLSRARQDGWTQFILDELEGPVWTAARHTFILPEARRVPAIKDTARWEFARATRLAAARLANGPFAMGDEMTVPDILLTHIGIWARRAKFDWEAPELAAYLERMTARPAWLRAAAL